MKKTMNKEYRHIGTRGAMLRAVLIATMLLAGLAAEAQPTIGGSVYGGGALANVGGDTKVILLGGTVVGDVYGGGKGRLGVANSSDPATYDVEPVEAYVGKVKVNLNGLDKGDYDATVHQSLVTLVDVNNDGDTTDSVDHYRVADDGGCVVKGSIFGCNNLNGSPLDTVKVHIFKTQGYDGHWRTGKNATTDEAREALLEDIDDQKHSYEVAAVYGGGNLAAYNPTEPESKKAWVIIDGCDLTSIRQVYGGGNAASTPATQVDVNGTYEIEEVFGGGNGKDRISRDGGATDIPNPGANVGYYDYTVYKTVDGQPVAQDADDADTPEKRQANYQYGTGQASVNIHGGRVHRVYGGSNTKGNVRKVALTMLEDKKVCAFKVDEAYGGGKSAPMDGAAQLEMACIPGLKAAYGGAEAANIQNNVVLNITNGNFDRVFGGNNISGTIAGTITVNIEETGCRPVIIGQLYGGGNQAAYTAPLKSDSDTEREPGPTLNVRSFTSIGEIYGGGYGKTAVVTGDTHVNINVHMGDKATADEASLEEDTQRTISFSEFLRTDDGGFEYDGEGNRKSQSRTVSVAQPSHKKGAIGAIGSVYGGGNAADVHGDTYVLIGTKDTEEFATTSTNPDHATVLGADIRGNVYGGGNQATVTGSTNVYVGKKKVE